METDRVRIGDPGAADAGGRDRGGGADYRNVDDCAHIPTRPAVRTLTPYPMFWRDVQVAILVITALLLAFWVLPAWGMGP